MNKLFLLSLYLIGVTSFGAQQQSRAHFKLKSRWLTTDYKSYQSGNNTITLKGFRRLLGLGKKSYPVASATMTHLYEAKEGESIDSIVKGIKVGYGDKTKWELEKITAGVLMRGDWSSANRSLRILILRPKKKEFVIFTSVARKGYLASIAGEIEILEKTILDFYKQQGSKSAFANLFILPAYAQGSPFPFFPVGSSSDPTSPLNPQNYEESINELTQATNELNNSVDQMVTESDQWQELLPELSNQWQTESDQWQDQSDLWRGMLEGESQAWGQRFDKLLDPTHMATLGFATAAGAALGTLAVNMAVDGIVWGVTQIFDLIFQVSANKERWERFSDARQLWEEAEKNALTLEKTLDDFLAAYESIAKTKGEDLLAAIQREHDKLSFAASELQKRYQNIEDCVNCKPRGVYQNMLIVNRQLAEYEKVLEFAKENKITNLVNSKNFYCDQLADLKRKINEAEMQLHELRIALIDGQAEWYRHERERFNERQNQIDRINQQRAQDETFRVQEFRLSDNLLDQVQRDAEKMDKNIPDTWMDDCIDGKSAIGKDLNQQLSRYALFRPLRIAGMCKEAYAQVYAYLHKESRQELDSLLEEARDLAQGQYEKARFRRIYDNPNAEMKHIIDMEQWFTKLEYEAECYGQMDDASPEYKELCRELSPKLVSLHQANQRAQSEWNEKCKNNWNNLQERFQDFHRGYTPRQQLEAYRNAQ